jgi:hypothetical protein
MTTAVHREEDFREAVDDRPWTVPALGVIGAAAIREAFEGDLQQLRDLLQGAVKKALELSGEEDWWPYMHAIFDDFFVVEAKDGRLLKYAYQVDGTKITLGTPVEVTKTFTPVEGGNARLAEGAFLEADEKTGGTWRIRVVRAGLSGNRNYYTDAVLREAAPMFEGVRVFVKSDAEHLAGGGKDVRNLIGRLSDVAFMEGTATDSGEIQATLTLIEPEGDVAVKLREAWSRGLTGLFGFSIDATARAKKITRGGQTVREARKFTKVKSVDLIVEPGAGGEIVDIIESKRNDIMDREQIIALLEAKGLLKGKKVEELGDDELVAIMREAIAADTGSDDGGGGDAGVTAEDVREAVRMVEARTNMRARIDASSLPDKAKERVKERFEGEERFTEAEVDTAIKGEADYLAEFTESGAVTGLGEGGRITAGESRFEKVAEMFDAFFDREHKDHRHARSFRECYIQVTGDTRVTGLLRNCDQVLLRESLESSSFDDVLGDSITRRMIKDYRAGSTYGVWRQVVTIVPINDFRTQERTRFGGYGDLPAVAEKGPYLALTSPTDEKATYAVTKRGGTEDVTLEMIKNDDVGVIMRIPIKLSRAAQRTLAKFVLDFLVDNPTVYDSIALFHASHGNLGSTALAAATLAAGRLAMLKQQEAGSSDPLGIGPRSILVPPDLEETAVDLFRRNTENDKTFAQSLALNVIPVWYWTDANDWVLSADPDDIPGLEIGFLDGEEEPALFVQDSPTGGSMFTHDKRTYKIRHIYGGGVTDYRQFYKAVVA